MSFRWLFTRWFKRKQNLINTTLLLILIVLLTLYYISPILLSAENILIFINPHLEKVSKLSAIIRDFFSIGAIWFAGAWTYYFFIKGRTLKSRLGIDVSLVNNISLAYTCGQRKEIVLMRCIISNLSKIKIIPLSIKVEFSYGRIEGDEIKYIKFKEISNLFNSIYEPSERVFLEPQDEMIFYLNIVLNTVNALVSAESDQLDYMLMVRLCFIDHKYYAWQQDTVLCINDRRVKCQ